MSTTNIEKEVIPIPEVRENEERAEFVERCIPIVIEDGTAADSDQAVAICNSMYDESKKSIYKGVLFKSRKEQQR